MRNQTLENWIWVLIYSGLLMLVVARFVHRAQASATWAWGLGGLGIALAVLGVVMIVVRSRRGSDHE